MKFAKIKNIEARQSRCYDITVENNHNFFCNGALIHNCDYRGEVKVILINHSQQEYSVKIGDRIAQLIFSPAFQAHFITSDQLTQTTRGTGGFGSTGT